MLEQKLGDIPEEKTPLSAFATALFGSLARADQRRWAQAYLEGLLNTPGKKSIRRIAASVSSSPTASQSLQQFINASPWDWRPAREELTRLVEQRSTPLAWTIGTAVLPKRGEHSCGVHRRFVPELGRTIRCQLGVGVFLATDSALLPVDWRVMLPDQWDEDELLRERAKVPDSARHRPLWAHALNLVGTQAARTSLGPVPVVANLSEYTNVVPLIGGLGKQGRDFVLGVPPDLQVLPARPRSSGPRGTAPYPPVALGVQEFLQRGGQRARTSTAAAPHRDPGHVQVLSGLVELPNVPGVYRAFTTSRATWQRPARVWLTSMTDQRFERLAALTRLSSGTSTTVATLERDHGLLDFEGRSFPGWHHHMTLVSAAYAYHRLAARPAIWTDTPMERSSAHGDGRRSPKAPDTTPSLPKRHVAPVFGKVPQPVS